ncbi:MAG: transposase [Bacteroidales bacterium]|nr:transposase [Bacteroidales bacterium]
MAEYNKENRRKNMRLHGYDYSRAGLYFLTIVVQNRLHLFGEICQDGHAGPAKMFLNDAGNMIEQWYHEIENKFPDKRCHEMVVMPNHFHCVIENMESDPHAPGNGRPRPGNGRPRPGNGRPRRGAPTWAFE